jgi:hypothetical protein
LKYNFADEVIDLFRIYAGMQKSDKLTFEWTQMGQNKLATVWTSPVADSTYCAIRCVAVVPNTTVAAALTLLLNDERLNEYDDMADKVEFITNVDEKTNIRRILFKGIWPTSPRDFVACTTRRTYKDGSVIIATRTPNSNVYPDVKSHVRGTIKVSGYLIQPSEAVGDLALVPKGHVRIQLQAHSELGGSLPTGIINSLSSAAPMKIVNTIADILSRGK